MIRHLIMRIKLKRNLPFGKKYRAQKRLAQSMRPDPEYATRRKAHSERALKGWQSRSHDFLKDPLVRAIIHDKIPVLNSKTKAVIRGELYRRDGSNCHYCGEPLQVHDCTQSKTYATIDHLVPQFIGGAWDLDNLVLAHQSCNQKSAARFTLVSERVRRVAAEAGLHNRIARDKLMSARG
jgi:5-methylcytosine-specific restriction endonuclease McrA